MNIREIAKLSGVSIATVSRVINSPHLVQTSTREHVEAIIRSSGYAPTRRTLRRRENGSRTLLFLFSEEDYVFYERISSGFDAVLRPNGYTMLFCPICAEAQRRQEQMKTLSCQQTAGAIWALRDFHSEEIALFTNKGIPLVLARKYDHAPTNFPHCYTDFSVGSFRMTQHLLSLGCRRIVLLVEKVSFQFVASFCGGWKRAYFENNLPYEESWIVHTPNTVEGGYEKVSELLRSSNAPDAFFCASNEMAFGALRAARELGIHVPAQLAIVGFTDSPIAMLSEPKLTTLKQPIQQLGAMAARMLIDRIQCPQEDGFQQQEIVLQPQLCIRESCGSESIPL